MKGSVRAYFNEAKWLHGEYIVPTVEEYMGVALVSSEVPMFTIISFVGMGMIATKEAFDWVLNQAESHLFGELYPTYNLYHNNP